MDTQLRAPGSGDCGVSLSRFPCPYRAMLAICSDLDETPDRYVYWEIARFLNTAGDTPMGPGVGLEVGNTVYFDMPPDQFAYWNTDDAGRAMVQTLIRSGHIDCLHSFGDLAGTREHARRALDELAGHDCRLKVWIDHGTAPTNFGTDIMMGRGSVPGSPVYHADLTCEYGIEYVWRGRVTSVIGQGVPRSLRGIGSWRHPLASARTIAKETAKGWLAARGDAKYAMHGSNAAQAAGTLPDGRPIIEFIRCNPHWGGVSCGDRPTGLPQVLTERFLDALVNRQGVCILYTHLGKITNRAVPFSPETVAAFRLLARYYREGRILVTTTRRLLDYCRMTREIDVAIDDNGKTIRVQAPRGLALDGLTLHIPKSQGVRVLLNGREPKLLWRHAADEAGRDCASVAWPRLEFPDS